MKPEMLEIKLRQYMSPGKPYYLKQILCGIGQELDWEQSTLERRLREVKSVYFRKIDKHKVYYIDELPEEPFKWSKHHDKAMQLLSAGEKWWKRQRS